MATIGRYAASLLSNKYRPVNIAWFRTEQLPPLLNSQIDGGPSQKIAFDSRRSAIAATSDQSKPDLPGAQ